MLTKDHLLLEGASRTVCGLIGSFSQIFGLSELIRKYGDAWPNRQLFLIQSAFSKFREE